MRGAPRGRLRINAGTAFGLHQLAPALADFLARYPEIDIDLSITDRLVDLIEEQADIAVRSGHIPDGPFIQRKIADLQRVICAAPSYLARRGTPQVPADLKSHDCIVVAGAGLNRWPFKTRSGGIDVVEVRPRVTTDDAEAALRLAIEGAGIIRLSEVIVGTPLRDGELVALLTDSHHVEPFPLAAIYPAGRQRLPRVAVFIEFLIERFAHAPWRLPGMPAPDGKPASLAAGLAERRRPRLDQRAQRQQRRAIGDAVDARRAEMALEGGDHRRAWRRHSCRSPRCRSRRRAARAAAASPLRRCRRA